jgi:hypothetical protein
MYRFVGSRNEYVLAWTSLVAGWALRHGDLVLRADRDVVLIAFKNIGVALNMLIRTAS